MIYPTLKLIRSGAWRDATSLHRAVLLFYRWPIYCALPVVASRHFEPRTSCEKSWNEPPFRIGANWNGWNKRKKKKKKGSSIESWIGFQFFGRDRSFIYLLFRTFHSLRYILSQNLHGGINWETKVFVL